MTRILVDSSLPDKVAVLTEPAEFCDATGRILGRYFPQPNPETHEGLEPPFSRKELAERRKLEGKTYTTAEVLAYLERLP
jgi:hypothetical protein